MISENYKTIIRLATENDVPGIRKAIRSSIEGIASKDYPAEVINNWGLDTEMPEQNKRRPFPMT